MRRRAFLATTLLLPAAAQAQGALSAQDRADIGRAEVALNAIHTLKARFQQIAPNGGVSGGTAWLDRPGRMRFQYDPPAPFLLVAGYGLLTFYDSQLQQTSNIPLGRTPVGLLLQDNLKLSGDVTVTKVARLPGQVQVTLLRTATPSEGSITLIFADNPMTLRSLDGGGRPAAGNSGQPVRRRARGHLRKLPVRVRGPQVFRQQQPLTTELTSKRRRD